jgi:hypothetical protein
MALSDYQVPTTKVIITGGTEVEVRGLSLQDITVAARHHYEEMKRLFSRVMEQMDAAEADEFMEALDSSIGTALVDFPDLVGTLVVEALVDEPDKKQAAAVFQQLDLPSQAALVLAIVNLTFQSEIVLGNALEAFARVLEKVTSAANALGSMNGSSASAGKSPLPSRKATPRPAVTQ